MPNILQKSDLETINNIRNLVFSTTRDALLVDNYCKSFEGQVSLFFKDGAVVHLKNYFESLDDNGDFQLDLQEITPEVMTKSLTAVEIGSYILCPDGRYQTWSGDDCLDQALQAVKLEWLPLHKQIMEENSY